MPRASSHRWRFFRAGGFDQVKLETGADLMALDQLDQKLWVALACPATGLEFDSNTLALIDTDKDGRIRASELIAAVKWAGAMLKNPDDLVAGGEGLPFASIADATPEGAALLASARQIAATLGKPGAEALTMEEISTATAVFANALFNGDGVIVPESAADSATASVIADIAACVGTVPDRSGKPGIDQARADAFFAECAAFDDWMRQGESDPAILPLGADTAAAAAAIKTIQAKVDDYFGRCRLAAFEPRAAALLNRQEAEYLAATARDISLTAAEVAHFPLARVAPGEPLPLSGAVNPAHAAALVELQARAVKPLLGGRNELSEADWLALQSRFAAFESWNANKRGGAVEKLGLARVREILGGKAKDDIAALIAKDQGLAPAANAIAAVEQLARYRRDLHRLCENFVNFKGFYGGGANAIFLAGTLYLDQRSCEFTLPVQDPARHAAMAGLAGAYLAYCDCARRGAGDEKRQIVAAFTDGDSENLMVGRNGVFYDRKGNDWDATILKIVDNPISLRQAFWFPYKKLVRFIEEQVTKRAAAAETGATNLLQAEAAPAAGAGPAAAKKIDIGTVAALGVTFSALGVAFTTAWAQIVGIIKLGPWHIVGAVLALLALVSGPSIVLAYVKLHKRNLGPILDANGWAVNAKAKINVPFGRSLTAVAQLPPGAQRDLSDPFAERRQPWKLYLVLLVLLLLAFSWYKGSLDRVLPPRFKSTSVLGAYAPAYQAPTRSPPPNPPPGK